jgi:hypothetical protein
MSELFKGLNFIFDSQLGQKRIDLMRKAVIREGGLELSLSPPRPSSSKSDSSLTFTDSHSDCSCNLYFVTEKHDSSHAKIQMAPTQQSRFYMIPTSFISSAIKNRSLPTVPSSSLISVSKTMEEQNAKEILSETESDSSSLEQRGSSHYQSQSSPMSTSSSFKSPSQPKHESKKRMRRESDSESDNVY